MIKQQIIILLTNIFIILYLAFAHKVNRSTYRLLIVNCFVLCILYLAFSHIGYPLLLNTYRFFDFQKFLLLSLPKNSNWIADIKALVRTCLVNPHYISLWIFHCTVICLTYKVKPCLRKRKQRTKVASRAIEFTFFQ